jgi:hypothetical protein
MNSDRELLREALKLLKRAPPATRSMYVGADKVPWGKQASELAKRIREAIEAKEPT